MSQTAGSSAAQPPETAGSRADYGAALEIGRRVLEHWTRGIFACAHDLTLFAMARTNQDFETLKTIARSTSVEELLRCQCDFAQKAAADYSAESARLFQLMTDFTGNALATNQQAVTAHADEKSAWQVTPSAPPPASPPERERRGGSRPRPIAARQAASDRGE